MPQTEYGLIGYPLEHSFSARFFTDMFAREAIDAKYLNFPIADVNLLHQLIADHPGLRGLNVTHPHKTAVIPLLDAIDPIAGEIGAVNTIAIQRSQDSSPRLIGYNTDIIGFIHSIAPHIDQYRHRHPTAPPLSALIFGTGGASRAIAAALRQLDIAYQTVSRTADRPDRLTYTQLTPELISKTHLLINATPLGMAPLTDCCPQIDYSQITPCHICFDAIYNPSPTLYLRHCADRGATIIDGLEMLHQQALASWDIWNR